MHNVNTISGRSGDASQMFQTLNIPLFLGFLALTFSSKEVFSLQHINIFVFILGPILLWMTLALSSGVHSKIQFTTPRFGKVFFSVLLGEIFLVLFLILSTRTERLNSLLLPICFLLFFILVGLSSGYRKLYLVGFLSGFWIWAQNSDQLFFALFAAIVLIILGFQTMISNIRQKKELRAA